VWGDLNIVIVIHGQNVCKPVRPRCWDCKVAQHCLTGQEYLANNPVGKTKKTKKTEGAQKTSETEKGKGTKRSKSSKI
jgi:adenine-specific DNA glycosylase